MPSVVDLCQRQWPGERARGPNGGIVLDSTCPPRLCQSSGHSQEPSPAADNHSQGASKLTDSVIQQR